MKALVAILLIVLFGKYTFKLIGACFDIFARFVFFCLKSYVYLCIIGVVVVFLGIIF